MKIRQPLVLAYLAILCGCASPLPVESPRYAARMNEAGERYTECITQEVEKNMQNPIGAEDLAVAAHARCWSAWEAYREAVNTSFMHGTRTPGERQFARDRSEGHLRQFEREARSTLVNAVIQRNMPGGGARP